MRDFDFTDIELRAAAAEARKAILKSLPEPEECDHVFSDSFEAKMLPLLTKPTRINRQRSVLRAIAAVFVLVFISMTVWLTVDAEARETVMRWAREIFEKRIVYRFDTVGDNNDVLPTYNIGWLPEGFTLTDVYEDDTWYSALYENESTGKVIVFEYRSVLNTTIEELIANGEITREDIMINGLAGDYVSSDDSTHNLTWFDEKNNIVFNIDSDLGKDEIFRIAESIEKE